MRRQTHTLKSKTFPKILLTHEFHPEAIRTLLRPQAEVHLVTSRKELKKQMGDADGLITLLTDKIDQNLLRTASRLKVIGNYAVGINNLDLSACAEKKIRIVNTPDVLTRATAETALTLLMAAARRVPEGEALCRSGKFRGWSPDLLLGLGLQGRQAVIVGAGRIGQETGNLFRAVGMQVQSITRRDSESSVEKKLKQAQVLSLHLPLTPTTHHWLNRHRLGLLPPDAIVINTARGPVIDETALIQKLKTRKIFAAGLDVYENEPKIPRALRKLPNTVLLPHVGSGTYETRQKMAELVISGVLGILSGKAPWNEVKF